LRWANAIHNPDRLKQLKQKTTFSEVPLKHGFLTILSHKAGQTERSLRVQIVNSHQTGGSRGRLIRKHLDTT
jgi:hypothetical protein